jgi:polysaccharide biosynthesis transport protein
MSHIFEALRKAEGSFGVEGFATPEAFSTPQGLLDVLEKPEEFGPVPSEHAHIKPESRLVVWEDPASLWAERFRLIRVRLMKLNAAGKLKTLLLTSPSPQDGKSTVALNLATSLVGREKNRILLVEADLRCPSLTGRLGLELWPGLSECLERDDDPMRSLRRIEPLGFFLLPAGKASHDPTELLQSERLAEILRVLSARFDFVLIDCAPTSPIADTLALNSKADATLLVARAGKTSRESLEESIQQLGKAHVLGVLLNGLAGLEKDYSDYYLKYYKPAGSTAPQQTSGKPK